MTRCTILLLSFLYFVQGMPYGIQIYFLPILLRTHGVSLTSIALFKLLFLPWVLKLLWAPYIDKVGSRKQWLLVTLLLQSIACALTSLVPFTNISLLAVMLFLQNICSSVQDISVDAMAVAVLAVEDVGLGNVAQVVGYKLGGVAAGGLYMVLYNTFGHGSTYLVLMIVYLTAFFIILNVDFGSMRSSVDKEKTTINSSCFGAVREAITMPGTVWLIAYTLFYKCGENGSIHMIPMFLLDNGVSKTKVALCTSIMGAFTTIIGSTFGGFVLKRFSVYKASYWLNIMRCTTLFAVMICNQLWNIPSLRSVLPDFLLALCCVQLFCSGVSSILTFSWMMHLSQNAPDHVQTTHYTTLATTETLGKILSSSAVGYITDSLGYSYIFSFLWIAVVLLVAMTTYTPNSLRIIGAV